MLKFAENRRHEDLDFDHVRLLRAVILLSLSYTSPQSDSFRPTADTIMDDPVVGRVNESVPRISLTGGATSSAIGGCVSRECRSRKPSKTRLELATTGPLTRADRSFIGF